MGLELCVGTHCVSVHLRWWIDRSYLDRCFPSVCYAFRTLNRIHKGLFTNYNELYRSVCFTSVNTFKGFCFQGVSEIGGFDVLYSYNTQENRLNFYE